jgi:hypothetical protein
VKLYPQWRNDFVQRGGTNWYRRGSNAGMRLINCEECGEECLAYRAGRFCSNHCAKLGANNPFFGMTGSDHSRWKGDDVTYEALHMRVYQARGRPDRCVFDSPECTPNLQWANLLGDYTDVQDFAPMCARCHKFFDNAKQF